MSAADGNLAADGGVRPGSSAVAIAADQEFQRPHAHRDSANAVDCARILRRAAALKPRRIRTITAALHSIPLMIPFNRDNGNCPLIGEIQVDYNNVIVGEKYSPMSIS